MLGESMGFDLHKATTKNGYSLGLVVSAMQKAIRRGDSRLAGYWAMEMHASGYDQYCWRRLLVISAEDCWGVITQEVAALRAAYADVNRGKGPKTGRVFIAKAVLLLSMAKKCRDADHLANLVYDPDVIDHEELLQSLEEVKDEPIPDYAYDVHTPEGRKRGKTKKDFFRDEQDALQPRQRGLFDGYVDE